jgi:hypothetical protein
MPGFRRLAALMTLASGLAMAVTAIGSVPAGAQPISQTFEFERAPQNFEVPEGVRHVRCVRRGRR